MSVCLRRNAFRLQTASDAWRSAGPAWALCRLQALLYVFPTHYWLSSMVLPSVTIAYMDDSMTFKGATFPFPKASH